MNRIGWVFLLLACVGCFASRDAIPRPEPLHVVTPLYPRAALDAGVEGKVVLRLLVEEDGRIRAVQTVSGPEVLRASAVEAARQFVFKPGVLHGKPVEAWKTQSFNFAIRSLTPNQRALDSGPVEAAKRGNLYRARGLLDDGANVDVAEWDGNTALVWAVEAGDISFVRMLLEAGAEVNVKDRNGHTPLMKAAAAGHAELVRSLLGAGAKVNAESKDGWTALMGAAGADGVTPLQILLDAGADVNAGDSSGHTALMRASVAGRTQNVKALLRAHADVAARTSHGLTAMTWATEQGHAEIVRLLRKAEAGK